MYSQCEYNYTKMLHTDKILEDFWLMGQMQLTRENLSHFNIEMLEVIYFKYIAKLENKKGKSLGDLSKVFI